MAEYIERGEAEKRLRQRAEIANSAYIDQTPSQIMMLAQNVVHLVPAADVRPVVLCRDCIFRSNEWTGCPKLNGTITGDEFFCKCGIKREES